MTTTTIIDEPSANPVADKNGGEKRQSRAEHIRREVRDDGICMLTFDRSDSGANIFDADTLLELSAHLDLIEKEDSKGLIFTSAKDRIFIAGADIKSVLSNPDPNEIDLLIAMGQEIFSRVAALKIPTVAAIHGACVGGGFELALACDYRVASPDKATRIGLPETQLGIIPAWGGSTRLPRLIGLPKALGLILPGKTVVAKHAKKLGLVDEVVPRENLSAMAANCIVAGKRPPLPRRWKWNNRISAAVLRWRVGKGLEAKTRGHYPAAGEALNVATRGISESIEKSLTRERRAIRKLITSPTTRNLIGIFLMQERAKKASVSGASGKATRKIDHAAVIGSGVMGAGIAQWLSTHGVGVSLCDIAPDRVAAGMSTIGKLNAKAVKRRIFSRHDAARAMDRVTPIHTRVPLTRADLVIEAAVEDLELKKKIFADLDARAGEHTILATNTSALPIQEIADATSRPENVLGLHFFNPVHRMQLVELVVADSTSQDAVARALNFVKRIGKLPVVVRDSPGFLVNRILLPYLIEAGWLFDQGVPAKDIDESMLEFGMPMGPLRLLDEVGNDVALHVARTLHEAFGDRLALPPIIEKLVEAKQLGRKTGVGFFKYGKKGQVENALALELRTPHEPARNWTRSELSSRMAALMVNEAAACLSERVIESPDDVDFGMIMGTGFAPFRGGPLRYADSAGVGEIVAQLKHAAECAHGHAERFAPHPYLLEKLESNTPFHQDKK